MELLGRDKDPGRRIEESQRYSTRVTWRWSDMARCTERDEELGHGGIMNSQVN